MAQMSFTADAGLAEIVARLSRTVPADGPRLRLDIGDDLSLVLDRAEWDHLVAQGNAAFQQFQSGCEGVRLDSAEGFYQ